MNRLRRDDRGQITTALVMVGTVMVVAVGMFATKLGQATDEKSQVQIAADAAALAGAQRIQQDAPSTLAATLASGSGCKGLGQAAASDFANRGGARLVQYCYNPGSGTVQVSVDSLTNSVSGSPAKATAESRVGLPLGDCVLPPSLTLTPTPTSTPAATAGPTPTTTPSPPDADGEVRCGDVSIPIVFDGAGGASRISLSESEIRELFTPALIS